ncbi:MAG: hypothetical protein LBF93_02325 [Zoogloeaceae bacterium]|jgi:hypothetical protein|nr:hypothetical protein [Zoogloeaceae bacterium]
MQYAPLNRRWEIFTASGLRLGSVGAKAGTGQDKALSRLITVAPELLALTRDFLAAASFDSPHYPLAKAEELLKRAEGAT